MPTIPNRDYIESMSAWTFGPLVAQSSSSPTRLPWVSTGPDGNCKHESLRISTFARQAVHTTRRVRGGKELRNARGGVTQDGGRVTGESLRVIKGFMISPNFLGLLAWWLLLLLPLY